MCNSGKRNGAGIEGLLRQAQHHGRIFADGVQHHRLFELSRHLAKDVNALRLEQSADGLAWVEQLTALSRLPRLAWSAPSFPHAIKKPLARNLAAVVGIGLSYARVLGDYVCWQ